MNITLQSVEPDDTLIITIQGNITSVDNSSNQQNPIAIVAGAGWASKTVIIDLRDVPYIDSSAIGWLINTHKQFEQNEGRMILHSIHPNVQQMFDLLNIDALFTITGDEPAARQFAIGA